METKSQSSQVWVVAVALLAACSAGGAGDGFTVGDGGAPITAQTATCKRYLACAAKAAPTELPMLTMAYGMAGTCWSGAAEVAAACETACEAGLDQLHSIEPSAPECAAYHFCAAMPAVGTSCVATFFRPVAACWTPSGSCVEAATPSSLNICFQNGARLSTASSGGGTMSSATWQNQGMTCLTENGVKGMPAAFTVGGETLRYDSTTFDVTCPDGTKTNVGDLRKCPEIAKLIAGATQCPMGSCP
jgi:hypothetical protein